MNKIFFIQTMDLITKNDIFNFILPIDNVFHNLRLKMFMAIRNAFFLYKSMCSQSSIPSVRIGVGHQQKTIHINIFQEPSNSVALYRESKGC